MQFNRFSLTAVMFMGLVYCSMVLPQATADEPFSIRTVMTNTVPELPEGVLCGFRAASINSEGRVAIDGNSVLNNYEFLRFIETEDSVSLVARSGTLIPTGDGQTSPIHHLWGNGALISENNRTGYACVPDSPRRQFFVSHELDGPAQAITANGCAAPGLPSGTEFEWFAPDFSYTSGEYRYGRAGTFSILARLYNADTSALNFSVWTGNENGLNAVAVTGDRAPGTEDGVVFSGTFTKYYDTHDLDYGYRAPMINGHDEVAFTTRLYGTGVDTTNNEGVWAGGADSLRLVARKGQYIDGMASGEALGGIYFNPVINNAGHTAFTGNVEDNDGDYHKDYALFADVAGRVEVVIREGMPAPGTPKDVVFDDYQSDYAPTSEEGSLILKTPLVDDSGLVAFMSYLRGEGVDGTNNVGLWTKQQDEPLELLVRMGDIAPGIDDESIVFDALGFAPGDDYSIEYRMGWQHPAPGFSLNGTGQVAFYATLRGDGIDYSNDGGIWATDENGELHLVVREGDQYEVAPGDVRTIRSLWFSQGGGGSDGSARAFNENGELVFIASFTDSSISSGVFVATIPEPTTLLLFALGVCLTARRLRRRAWTANHSARFPQRPRPTAAR